MLNFCWVCLWYRWLADVGRFTVLPCCFSLSLLDIPGLGGSLLHLLILCLASPASRRPLGLWRIISRIAFITLGLAGRLVVVTVSVVASSALIALTIGGGSFVRHCGRALTMHLEQEAVHSLLLVILFVTLASSTGLLFCLAVLVSSR